MKFEGMPDSDRQVRSNIWGGEEMCVRDKEKLNDVHFNI